MSVYRENSAPIAPDIIRCVDCGYEHPFDGFECLVIETSNGIKVWGLQRNTMGLYVRTGDGWTLLS